LVTGGEVPNALPHLAVITAYAVIAILVASRLLRRRLLR